MGKLALMALVASTVVFDAFVVWAAWFTVAWAGSVPPVSEVGFWLFASSPLLATAYAVAEVRAFRREQQIRV